MRWRDRFLFCAEAIYKSQAETGEIKPHHIHNPQAISFVSIIETLFAIYPNLFSIFCYKFGSFLVEFG
jgi:hypothetical protein